ncbi:HPF/RaiA family ribosome-associated protein [Flavobacterium sp. Sd200]|uniref:HPF/RaiA family ribosome-associated protein n=1 Tax=Flavobacterium sp. Sd200 TaxID=2692211 RepID=UPI00136E21B5|nr:HPF/RaiA family ribosome-associated protein [Flavobacterium sp. Sd200]MXN92114.1 HPF/RaiA family ribosome-associated protein [Flavobacterium sp. Sd200]
MNVTINTDNHITGSDRMENYFSEVLHNSLKRFEDKITSIEIHLTDENGSEKSSPDDKKCVIEARVNGMPPQVVSNHAPSVELAIKGAADKMKKLLDHAFDKVRTH